MKADGVGDSNPSCLPSCAPRGLSNLVQGLGKVGKEEKWVRAAPGEIGWLGASWPHLLLLPVQWSGHVRVNGAWAPFKARGALPGPLMGSQREE